jgi:hypothetical protein
MLSPQVRQAIKLVCFHTVNVKHAGAAIRFVGGINYNDPTVIPNPAFKEALTRRLTLALTGIRPDMDTAAAGSQPDQPVQRR